jgi:hypothetical protein
LTTVSSAPALDFVRLLFSLGFVVALLLL